MELKEKVFKELYLGKHFNKQIDIAVKQISHKLDISQKKVAEALKELSKENRIKVSKSSRLIESKSDVKTGVFNGSKKSKHGFIKTIDNQEYYLHDKGTISDGDVVKFDTVSYKNKQEAFVVEIEKRNNLIKLGRIAKNEGKYVFISDDKKSPLNIILPQTQDVKDAYGKKVAVKIESFDESGATNLCFAKLEKVFGLAGDPIVENVAIAFEYGFVKEFEKEIEEEVEALSREITQEEISQRVDLRHIPLVTIDGADCKDKDDSVYVEKTDDGFKVYVAIADVAHYVQEGTKTDEEAYSRGTSCYLGDGVYPMLPERLSNDICSLNEGEDKLAMTAIIDIDNKGNIVDYDIVKSVIRLKYNLTYENVEDMYENKNDARIKFFDIAQDIDRLYEVNEVLMKYRKKRGALEFRGDEPSFKFDETKTKVDEILDKNNTLSRKVIESLMVLANEAVGEYFVSNQIPVLFRVHDIPEQERLVKCAEILKCLGVNFEGDGSQEYIQEFLKSVENNPSVKFINDTVLRCMQKAKYSPVNIGHFGLASPAYIHFTSPIRRYPDTLTHRILHEMLEKGYSTHGFEEMVKHGEYLSNQERKADLAERDSDQLLMAIWAEGHIGETFETNIIEIKKDALKVRYGLVEMTLPFDVLPGSNKGIKINQGKTMVKLISSGKTFKIGDVLNVKIAFSDRASRSITCSYETKNKTKEKSHKKENSLEK